MSRRWTADDILEMARRFQPACVLAAAVDLDLFDHLGAESLTAEAAAKAMGCDRRATAILLDALTGLELLRKEGERYAVPESLIPLVARGKAGSVLAMAQHQANCLRRWAQLAKVVRAGRPAAREPSLRGEQADLDAFIGAMHDVSAPVADEVIGDLKPLASRRVLDVGGGSGTWTAALLRACPEASAVLFDLPEVIPLARSRLTSLGLGGRVDFAAGDYNEDPLPGGVDLAWVSAIIHQNSRRQNRRLFAAAQRSLDPGGLIAVRDILMDPSRTSPPAGALFAVNMLVATEGGGTYTFDEIREDLEEAGFISVACPRRDPGMNSLVTGRKPPAQSP